MTLGDLMKHGGVVVVGVWDERKVNGFKREGPRLAVEFLQHSVQTSARQISVNQRDTSVISIKSALNTA